MTTVTDRDEAVVDGAIAPVSGIRSTGRGLAVLYVAGGLVGWVAAFVLLIEKIRLLEDPDYIPTCSISPLFSCGSVMSSDQAEAFGFPNPILGVTGFAAAVTIGVAVLAGAVLARWFWIGAQVTVTAAVVFVHWLIFQSLYRIGALCPYCMVVWAVTIPIFWYTTVHNLRTRQLRPPRALRPVTDTLVEFHAVVLTAWFLAIIVLIAVRFADYWASVLT